MPTVASWETLTSTLISAISTNQTVVITSGSFVLYAIIR